MNAPPGTFNETFNAFIDAHRSSCLWFLRADYYPVTRAQRLRASTAELAFDSPPPDAGDLSRRWHALLEAAHGAVRVLPAEEAGKCVLTPGGQLFMGDQEQAREAVSDGSVRFHAGCLRGAFPQFVLE